MLRYYKDGRSAKLLAKAYSGTAGKESRHRISPIPMIGIAPCRGDKEGYPQRT
jgi:hypothetical protein